MIFQAAFKFAVFHAVEAFAFAIEDAQAGDASVEADREALRRGRRFLCRCRRFSRVRALKLAGFRLARFLAGAARKAQLQGGNGRCGLLPALALLNGFPGSIAGGF